MPVTNPLAREQELRQRGAIVGVASQCLLIRCSSSRQIAAALEKPRELEAKRGVRGFSRQRRSQCRERGVIPTDGHLELRLVAGERRRVRHKSESARRGIERFKDALLRGERQRQVMACARALRAAFSASLA